MFPSHDLDSGLEIEGTQQDEDHDSVFYSKNPYIQLINIARSKEIDPVKYYHLTDNPQISLNKLKIISEELQRYKSEHGLVDFPDMIEKFLETTDPDKIGYFTFSKNAAVEGKERAALKFRLSMLDDLPYFQTLHSFCFNQLSLSKDQVMKEKHYKELGEKMGLEIEGTPRS